MTRHSELLKAAADALEDDRDPFSGSFLTEHEVTSGECMDLADSLAIGARLYAWAIENPKQAVAAAEGASIGMRLDLITRALKKL
jgi:hypothetical protein